MVALAALSFQYMQLEPEEDKQYTFRFSGGGYPCPYCHSRTGWSYIRNYGKEYGVCFACGTSNYPNGDKTVYRSHGVVNPNDKHSIQYIPLQLVDQTLTAYHSNPLVRFLDKTFGAAKTEKIIYHFKVGTARNRGTVFWYFDKEGYCRKPKVVFYASDGHRIKDDPDRKPHCAGYTNAKGYTLPLFGEHQLNHCLYPVHTPVVLVESEKTALIGYAFLPQYVWLASGGSRSMNKARASALKNRQVLILPDADDAGREGAQRTLHMLNQLGIGAYVKDLFPNMDDSSDLADYLVKHALHDGVLFISEIHPIQRLPLAHPLQSEKLNQIELMFNRYPVLWQLTEQLGLEITG